METTLSSKKKASDEEPGSESARIPTSLWNPSPVPVERERRKNPGAKHRHQQDRTGVPPTEAVEQREEADTPYPNNPVPLWDESEQS